MDNNNVIRFPGSAPRGSGNADARQWLADFHALVGATGPHTGAWMDRFAPAPPKLLRKRSTKVAYVVRVDLDGARPPIWRRLRLASDITLSRLHEIIQIAMGWADSHLHHFVMGPDDRDLTRQHFLSGYDIEEGEEGIAEGDVRLDQVLAKPGQRLFYEYDFGDGWRHTIKLEKVEPWTDGDPDAVCLTGRRACPPEDVGGLPGLEDALEMLAGRTEHLDPEWVEQVLTWLPEGYDPASFSVDEANGRLAAPALPYERLHPSVLALLLKTGGTLSPLAGLVAHATEEPALTELEILDSVRGYQLLLDLVGDGLNLTQAGYLPPRIVETLFTELKLDATWVGKGNREDMTLPVLELRESATALGLIRKAKGKLTVTAAGRKVSGSPYALFAHIASRLPLGRQHELDAGALALLYVAAGKDWYASVGEAATIMEGIGWREASGRLDRGLYEWSRPTTSVLNSLAGGRPRRASQAALARTLLRTPGVHR